MAWARHGMASVNQTQLHCVNQMGKIHSKPLVARHGRGTAWARHATCGSDFSLSATSYQVTEWLANSPTHQPNKSPINQPTQHTTHQSTEKRNNQTTNPPINQFQGVVSQLIRKFPVFYDTWGCITMFTTASHLFLSSPTIIKSINSHPSSSKHILISSCHLCPCL